MAWTNLPTNYTNASWSGNKKYKMTNNSDGTISLEDVTVYTNEQNSFFGAADANAMNSAINDIMAQPAVEYIVEKGTTDGWNYVRYNTNRVEAWKELSIRSTSATMTQTITYPFRVANADEVTLQVTPVRNGHLLTKYGLCAANGGVSRDTTGISFTFTVSSNPYYQTFYLYFNGVKA